MQEKFCQANLTFDKMCQLDSMDAANAVESLLMLAGQQEEQQNNSGQTGFKLMRKQ